MEEGEERTRRLVRLLRLAYSGELAAALAYRGHARSARDASERERIARIEGEERDHRERVGRMLARLGAAPDPARERRARIVGASLGLLCRVAGWFLPMYGAGRLESRNIREYECAAREALLSGRAEFVDDLIAMAETEREHERYFRERASSHWLWRCVPKWRVPPPKERIRASIPDAMIAAQGSTAWLPARKAEYTGTDSVLQ